MRVIVCGGRDYSDGRTINLYLSQWPIYPSTVYGNLRWDLRDAAEAGDLTIITGGARGADTLAQQIALESRYGTETWRADWKRHGKGPGPIRNQQMLDAGADLVLAFPGGRGTADMVRRAREAGVPVLEVGASDG